jgi:hypothetical protein
VLGRNNRLVGRLRVPIRKRYTACAANRNQDIGNSLATPATAILTPQHNVMLWGPPIVWRVANLDPVQFVDIDSGKVTNVA